MSSTSFYNEESELVSDVSNMFLCCVLDYHFFLLLFVV